MDRPELEKAQPQGAADIPVGAGPQAPVLAAGNTRVG